MGNVLFHQMPKGCQVGDFLCNDPFDQCDIVATLGDMVCVAWYQLCIVQVSPSLGR